MTIMTGWTLRLGYSLTFTGFVFPTTATGSSAHAATADTAFHGAWLTMAGLMLGAILLLHALSRTKTASGAIVAAIRAMSSRLSGTMEPVRSIGEPLMAEAVETAGQPGSGKVVPRPPSRSGQPRNAAPKEKKYKSVITVIILCIAMAGALYAGRNYATDSLLDAVALNQSGDRERAERMIRFGADVNARQDNVTPLLIIARRIASNQSDAALLLDDAIRLADVLIAKGANVNAAGERGNTPLHYAFDRKMAELLLSKGADVNAKNEKGETPLHAIAYLNHPAPPGTNSASRSEASARQAGSAMVMIEHGANVNAVYQDGVTPLQAAVLTDNIEVAKLLVASGSVVNQGAQSTGKKNTLLHDAILSPEMVKLLLAGNADINARGVNDYTPLHEACNQIGGENVKTVISLLIAAGANVNAASSKDGNTPLHHAALAGNVEAVRLLIASGANVNAVNMEGKSPLSMARNSSGNAEERIRIFDLLKQSGAYEASASPKPGTLADATKHD